jgi:hypothetical protein
VRGTIQEKDLDINQLLIKEETKELKLMDTERDQPQENLEVEIEEELKKDITAQDREKWKTKRDSPWDSTDEQPFHQT